MRLSTASTRRAIDKWKRHARSQATRSKYWALEMVSGVVTSARREKLVVLPFLGLAVLFNFAAIQFGVLVLIGFFVAKLHCYRLVNSVMGLLTFT
ncbi:MAG: hypothetical protein JRM80_12330 [Nitrososphaerota archaeon]|nr:hypothetical protein [Nitrososphaerota archaeon]